MLCKAKERRGRDVNSDAKEKREFAGLSKGKAKPSIFHMERTVVKFKLIDRSLGYCPAHKPGRQSTGHVAGNRIPKASEADREACLNCTKTDCSRCKGPGKGKPGPASKDDPAVLEALIRAGYNRTEIAERLGVSESTVHVWIHKLKGGNKESD